MAVLDRFGDGVSSGDKGGERRVGGGECHSGAGGSAWGANDLVAADGEFEVDTVDAPLV